MTGEQEYTEQTDTEHTRLRAELWMREYSLSTYDRQQTVLAQLQELAENAHLDALSVNTWYKYITTATSEYPDRTTITGLDKSTSSKNGLTRTATAFNPASSDTISRHWLPTAVRSSYHQFSVSPSTVVSGKDFVGAICLTINQVR
jgi:hypothetical protein